MLQYGAFMGLDEFFWKVKIFGGRESWLQCYQQKRWVHYRHDFTQNSGWRFTGHSFHVSLLFHILWALIFPLARNIIWLQWERLCFCFKENYQDLEIWTSISIHSSEIFKKEKKNKCGGNVSQKWDWDGKEVKEELYMLNTFTGTHIT